MESIQPLIPAVVARAVRPAPLTPEKVVFAWRLAVGAALARVTRVRLTTDHAIEVHVDDARWCDEIERSGDIVLARVQAVLGAEHARRLVVRKPAGKSHARRRRPTGTPRLTFDEGESS
jgi:hypothetical protein